MAKGKTPPECANCGAEIPPNARACPQCGADERTGWDEQSVYDGMELPDDDDTARAHDRFVEEEVKGGRPRSRRDWFWWAVALGLLVSVVTTWVFYGRMR